MVVVLWFMVDVTRALGSDAEAILRSYAEDYATDPTAQSVEIGFDVSGQRFFLEVGRSDSGPHSIEFSSNFPEDRPIIYWEMSLDTLRRIEAGMTGETATQRGRASDDRLMVLRATPGFPGYLMRRNGAFQQMINAFKIHFFIKGRPEIVPIGPDYAVGSHGTRVIGLVYQPRVSVVVTNILPGDVVNEDSDLDTNPFGSVFIATSGRVRARIGDVDAILEAGHALFVPADVEHVFWNDFDEPYQGVMVLYGPWLNESPPERPYPW
jgi:quercetin dioxygenase-like cupin family protein